MNHSECKCSHDPLTCDKSEFRELLDTVRGEFKRWVVCTDYFKNEHGKLIECDEHYRVEDGVKIIVRKGELCVNAPPDWWEEYLKGGANDLG